MPSRKASEDDALHFHNPPMNVQRLKRVVPRPLWPYLGAARRWVRVIPPRPQLHKKRLLSDPSLSLRERELLSKVSSRIYYQDGMYDEDGAHYYKVGLSAIHCIDEALERAKLTDVRTILDLPCGSGRVMRFLVQRFPEAEITACEMASTEQVEFCARVWRSPAFSSLNLDEVSLGKEFDLIWCGSLVTHLNETGIVALLKLVLTSPGDRRPDDLHNSRRLCAVAEFRDEGFRLRTNRGTDRPDWPRLPADWLRV